MNRKIPNKPHPTPNPDKPHTGAGADRGNLARKAPTAHGTPGQSSTPGGDPESDEPTYDSCFDDLNMVLSQSMEQPDPDPNLAASGEAAPGQNAAGPGPGPVTSPQGRAPRTSEIFRSVVASGGGRPAASDTGLQTGLEAAPLGEIAIPDLGVNDRCSADGDTEQSEGRQEDSRFPWGHVLLLSYSSAITLALSWMFWTGRISRTSDTPKSAAEKPAVESTLRTVDQAPDPEPPPLPPENLTRLGKTIRLGDLEVTPLSIEARPLELVHTIDPDRRRREKDCLVLRLRLQNRSADQDFTPLNRNLVRDRDLRTFDPYIATSEGPNIPLFPLALDSEWSIVGQRFPALRPGESAETFIAAEPGSARKLADEMTWRVRLRIGVYRSDMLGVRFTRADVRHPRTFQWEDFE